MPQATLLYNIKHYLEGVKMDLCISKVFESFTKEEEQTISEAIINILTSVVICDGVIHRSESDKIREATKSLPWHAEYNIQASIDKAMRKASEQYSAGKLEFHVKEQCKDIKNKQIQMQVIDKAREIASVDLELSPSESEKIEQIRRTFRAL